MPGIVLISVQASDDVGVDLVKFEYSTDGGAHWGLIGYEVQPQGSSYYWQGGTIGEADVAIRATASDPWGNQTSALASGHVDKVAPEPPTGLNATGTPSGIILSWQASSSADTTQYAIYRSTASGGPYDEIGTTSELTFVDTNALASCYYVVTALDSCGNESGRSPEAEGSEAIEIPSLSPGASVVLDGVVTLAVIAQSIVNVASIEFDYSERLRSKLGFSAAGRDSLQLSWWDID